MIRSAGWIRARHLSSNQACISGPTRSIACRSDPAQAEFVRIVRPAVERYRNMGIRVEDSFLMTATGPDNLSRKAPRLVRDLERVIGTGR